MEYYKIKAWNITRLSCLSPSLQPPGRHSSTPPQLATTMAIPTTCLQHISHLTLTSFLIRLTIYSAPAINMLLPTQLFPASLVTMGQATTQDIPPHHCPAMEFYRSHKALSLTLQLNSQLVINQNSIPSLYSLTV